MTDTPREIPTMPRPAKWVVAVGVLLLACIAVAGFSGEIGEGVVAQKAVAITTGGFLTLGTFLMTIALSFKSAQTRTNVQVLGGALSTAAGLMVVIYAVVFI